MKVRVTISFEYHFSGERLSEGAHGDLVSFITSFYSNLKRHFDVENLKIEIKEMEGDHEKGS